MEPSGPTAASGPNQLVEHFFRHETGRLHGALLRLVGAHNLQLAEDVAQEAMLRALRHWSMGGVPANPAAWITRVAMNLARDAMRHQRLATFKEPAIATHHEQTMPTPALAWEGAKTIRDDALRLMFVCCHPEIAADAQVILALKIMCGFTVGEIATAFFATESAIEKQLTRTKQRIRDAKIAFEIPEGENLEPRLNGALGTLYLLFNEGYKASAGDELLREDLCQEAIRLTLILVNHPIGDAPACHALLALMLLNAARFPTRLDGDGALRRLDDQDRSRWDQSLIERGLSHLARSAQGETVSEYHLQAGIAALHCTAPSYAATDWGGILRHYDALLALKPSPIVALNRAVALAQAESPRAALDAIETMADRQRLEDHYLLHAVLGDLYLKCGDNAAAIASLRRALELVSLGPEQAHLRRALQQIENAAR